MYRNFGVDCDLVPPSVQIRQLAAEQGKDVSRDTTNIRRGWLLPKDDDNETVLRLAKILISHGHWCQSRFATDAGDMPVDELGDKAHHFCIVGAIRRANHCMPAPRVFARYWRQRRYQEAIRTFYKVIDHSFADLEVGKETAVMVWNDRHNYGEVLAACNRAIVIAPYSEVI